MATIRTTGKPALLVIDVQNGVVARAHDRDAVVANIRQLADRANTDEVPVFYVQHEAEDLVRESESWQLVPELAPQEADHHIYKRYNDAFADTDLEAQLAELGVSLVYVTGAATNACVRSTVYGAMNRGYDVTLVSDAHTTDDISWEGIEISAQSMIDDLNLTMQFIEHPGVDVTSIPTAQVDQSAPCQQ